MAVAVGGEVIADGLFLKAAAVGMPALLNVRFHFGDYFFAFVFDQMEVFLLAVGVLPSLQLGLDLLEGVRGQAVELIVDILLHRLVILPRLILFKHPPN